LLKFNNKKKKFNKVIKSGLFFDFFLKKSISIFIKNILINSSLFFGEKYIIENLTKKIFNKFILKFNNKLGLTSLQYKYLFYNILYFIFFYLFILNLFIIFFV